MTSMPATLTPTTPGFLPAAYGDRPRQLTLACLLLPALLALGVTVSFGWPATLEAWLTLGGRYTGVLGLLWLLLAMLLSIRVPGWDLPLGGMPAAWRVHHYLGAGAFLSLLAHPILLLLAQVPAGHDAVLSLLQPALVAWPLWTGWLALLCLLLFLAPSFAFFGRPNYQRWKWLHLLAGPAAVLALLHGIRLSTSLAPGQAWLLWGGLGALAMLAFFWRAGLARLFARRPYQIQAVQPLATGVVELALTPLGRPLQFYAGQFMYLTPMDPGLHAGRGEEHPYTLSSAPAALPALRIAIKDLGDASGALQQVAVGSKVYLEGPFGRFLTDPVAGPQLWIGGGIGITPFVSAIRQLCVTPCPLDIVLIYCANDPSRAYYLDELQRSANQVSGLQVLPHYWQDQGNLDADFLKAAAPDLQTRQVYICGPLPLNQLAATLLRQQGVPARHIHTEAFDLL